MPTLITHSLIGLAATATLPRPPRKAWLLALLCAVLPDFDVIGFSLGIPYAHPLGHRGFFHSLAFAALLGLLAAFLCMRNRQAQRKTWLIYWPFFALIAASHGLADACTNGGLGIALWAPFDNQRIFFDQTPIAVSPLNPRLFFSGRMLAILFNEMRWVWLPLLSLVIATRLLHRSQRSLKTSP